MVETPTIVNQAEQFADEFSEAEAVLPLQFYGARRGTARTGPLRRLMAATLVDAIRCFHTKLKARQPARGQKFGGFGGAVLDLLGQR